MKLYIYISESVNLSDLVPITEFSKVSNKANNITGILSYSNGHYLQIIEGEDNKVGSVIKSIRKDNRHQNMIEVLDVEIEERFFSDWSMNLVPLLNHNEEFIAVTNFLNDNIELLSQQQKRIFSVFHQLTASLPSRRVKESQHASPLVYSINEWPNFEVVEPSSCLMSLCGLIMNNPKRFNELSKQHFYGSEQQLRSMLNELNKAGYLKVTMLHTSGQYSEAQSNVGKPVYDQSNSSTLRGLISNKFKSFKGRERYRSSASRHSVSIYG